MSLQQFERVLGEQKIVLGSTPSSVVGHAAPLRAKIAQFESKGGVPRPRPGESFGISVPAVDPTQPRRGELYGNRMRPVWVPSLPSKPESVKPKPLAHSKSQRIEVVNQMEETEPVPALSNASPLLPPQSSQDMLNQEHEAPLVVVEDIAELVETDAGSSVEDGSVRDVEEVSIPELEIARVLPTPISTTTSPSVPPPSPPDSLISTNQPRETLNHDVEKQQPVLSHSQTPSFFAVVHPKTREPPSMDRYKRLPPTPPLMTPSMANADLAALLLDAATLERKLLAGELPADVIRRLSMRPPPPIAKDQPGVMLFPVRRVPGFVDGTTEENKANKSLLNFSFKRKHKTDLTNNDSAWFPESTTPRWKLLVSTTRHTRTRS